MATPASATSNKSTTTAVKPTNGTKTTGATTATAATSTATATTGDAATTATDGKKKRGGKSDVPYKAAKVNQFGRVDKILSNLAKKLEMQGKKEGAPTALGATATIAAKANALVKDAVIAFQALPDTWAPVKSAGARNRGTNIAIGATVWIVADKRKKYEFALPAEYVRAPMTVEKSDSSQVAVRMADKILRVFPKVHVQLTDPAAPVTAPTA